MKKKCSSPAPAELSPAEIKALKKFEALEKFIASISGPSKNLSDYAKHITSEAQAYFEKEKNEQLSAALSPATQWRQIPYRVDDLAEIIVLLAPIVPHSDPPTEAQIDFWAMLEAYREYMNTGKQLSDREVSRQLTMDMTFAFCRLLVEGMDIAAGTKLQLQEALDEITSKDKRISALEIIARDKLIQKHPPRPTLTIQEAAAACGVDPKTISRWEKYRRGETGGTEPPKWYKGRDMTFIELKMRAEDARAQESVAKAGRRSLKNASRYIEDHDQPADDDE